MEGLEIRLGVPMDLGDARYGANEGDKYVLHQA